MMWSRREGGAAPLARWWAHPAGRLARAGAVAVLAAVLVAWWVRDDGASSAAGSPPAPAATTPRASAQDLSQLAAAAGCRAKITGENSGFRQAVCQTPAARYTLTTFSTDQGQQDWLSEAIPYGGAYLVGTRWVVDAQTPLGLPELAAKLGGTIVDKSQAHHS
ncbi:MAG: hypothetical protein V7637_3937 [Mycobacteriales bacterium]|jgi:hypothetical protein